MSNQFEQHIGDGVCVSWDGYHVVLKTSHINPTNTIALSPHVRLALIEYFSKMQDHEQYRISRQDEQTNGELYNGINSTL